MKKLNYLLLGLAGLTLASCSQDDLLDSGADGNYAITVQLPADMATRASLGDDLLQAQNLHYAVFDMGGNFIEKGSTEFPEGSYTTTVPLSLASGSSFQIAFFAQSPQSETDGVYSFNASDAAHSITVDYSKMESGYNNADDYDCFYKLFNTGVIGSSTNTQVVLNRLVAQINWGTNDYGNLTVQNTYGENLANLQATLSTEAYTVFDLITQEVSEAKTVKIGAFTPNNGTDAPIFPVEGDYQYVAMQYVLVPSTPTLSTLELSIKNASGSASKTLTVDNAPLQTNYRTNIYGSLLTDNVTFDVELSDVWGGPDYEVDLTPWDGQTKTTPLIDTSKKTITILKASDLAGLADLVTGGLFGNSYSGYTVTLAADFDMGGNTFAGLGTGTRLASVGTGKSFAGTFDGKGHTISNLVINGSNSSSSATGFIPNLAGSNASLTNVNFENIQINAPSNEQAGIVGLLSGGATVSNVTVKSGSISAKGGAGGIVGRVLGNGSISDCNNYATITINGDASGGGIAGAAYYTSKANSVTISGCNNYGTIIVEGSTTQTIGGIVGTSGADVIECNNYGQVGNNLTNGPAGGIVGYQNSCGTIRGCVNEGTVMAASQAAGIVGWVGAGSYTYKGQITIESNVNSGDIIGTGTVGGIMAINRNTVYMNNNTNKAAKLVCENGTVAGILGNGYQQSNPSPVSGGDGLVHLTGNVNETPLASMTGKTVANIYTGVVADGSQSND